MKEKEPIGGKGSVWDVGTVNFYFIFSAKSEASKQAAQTRCYHEQLREVHCEHAAGSCSADLCFNVETSQLPSLRTS
jgi:hypothetical protein